MSYLPMGFAPSYNGGWFAWRNARVLYLPCSVPGQMDSIASRNMSIGQPYDNPSSWALDNNWVFMAYHQPPGSGARIDLETPNMFREVSFLMKPESLRENRIRLALIEAANKWEEYMGDVPLVFTTKMIKMVAAGKKKKWVLTDKESKIGSQAFRLKIDSLLNRTF